MSVSIRIEHVSKRYRLGVINRDMLYKEFQSWWAQRRGKVDPHAAIHEAQPGSGSGPEEFWALRDISFDVNEGEVVGIVGKNGSGKSTLLKILSRITAPTEGRVLMRGRVASLLEVGTGFHSELSGRDNIFLNGSILGMNRSEIRSRFDEIVAFSGVEKFLETPVKRYSSGMRVRLAFAVAAHLDPDILIIDEVLAVGDAKFQQTCMQKIESARAQGRTILFVSHDTHAVLQLCQRAVVLDAGRIRFVGTTPEAVNFYLDELHLPHEPFAAS